jgi:hypothetical protein
MQFRLRGPYGCDPRPDPAVGLVAQTIFRFGLGSIDTYHYYIRHFGLLGPCIRPMLDTVTKLPSTAVTLLVRREFTSDLLWDCGYRNSGDLRIYLKNWHRKLG